MDANDFGQVQDAIATLRAALGNADLASESSASAALATQYAVVAGEGVNRMHAPARFVLAMLGLI